MDVRELALGMKVVGGRATLKAIQKGEAKLVFLAKDAEERVLAPVRAACLEHGIETVEVATMLELGQAARLQVGAAAAALLREI